MFICEIFQNNCHQRRCSAPVFFRKVNVELVQRLFRPDCGRHVSCHQSPAPSLGTLKHPKQTATNKKKPHTKTHAALSCAEAPRITRITVFGFMLRPGRQLLQNSFQGLLKPLPLDCAVCYLRTLQAMSCLCRFFQTATDIDHAFCKGP